MAQKGRGIFMVYVDIDAQHAPEFNEWYNKEHLPELLSVPGILSAARYEAVKGGPKYLACYELESVAVMQTPAFTSRPRTPWGQKVSPSVIGKNLTRIVGEQIYPDGVEMPERGMAPVLQIGRMSVPAEVDAEWNAWYSGEYVPGYRKVPGVIYARRYRVIEGTVGYSTVYEFASTAVPESPEWKEQQEHSSPNSPRIAACGEELVDKLRRKSPRRMAENSGIQASSKGTKRRILTTRSSITCHRKAVAHATELVSVTRCDRRCGARAVGQR